MNFSAQYFGQVLRNRPFEMSVLGTGMFLYWKKWRTQTGILIVLYWLGCAIATMVFTTALFDSQNIRLFGLSGFQNG